jgi:hypothetical protein
LRKYTLDEKSAFSLTEKSRDEKFPPQDHDYTHTHTHTLSKNILLASGTSLKTVGRGGVNSSKIYLIHCKEPLYYNATMYPHPAQQ